MLDLIIRGGDVVTPQGVVRCDVAVKGETIAAVAAPGTLEAATTRAIDAAGTARAHTPRHATATAARTIFFACIALPPPLVAGARRR